MPLSESNSLKSAPLIDDRTISTQGDCPQGRLDAPIQTENTHEDNQDAGTDDQNGKLEGIWSCKPRITTREIEAHSKPPSSHNALTARDPVPNNRISPSSTLASSSRGISPAAKRRRVEFDQSARVSVNGAAQNGFIASNPSEARDGVLPEIGDNTESGCFATHPGVTQQTTKTRKPRLSEKAKGKRSAGSVTVEITTAAVGGSSNRAPRTKKLPRASAKRRRATVEDAAAILVANAVEGSPAMKKTKRERQVREATPEGAEMVKITPSTVKMSDLCKNLRTGKKSTREKELVDLEKAEAVRKSQRQLHEVLEAIDTDTTRQPDETAEDRLERLSRAGEQNARAVPNTIIVDGEIQIDETSLQIDRHANAAVERDAEAQEGIDESELTRRVTSSSWLKRDPGGRWNEESTERFFEALQMFGTNFDMISKLFPGRTRRSIKLKFLKEEKADAEKIKQTLMGERILVDMDEYSRISNTIYADPSELEKDLAEDRKLMEEEQRAAKEALDEAARQREQEVEAERAAAEKEEDEESLARNNGVGAENEGAKRKRGGKTKREKKPGRAKKKPSEVTAGGK